MFGFTEKLFGPKTNFKKLIEEGALIIDVRTPSEFESGHITGSMNIPLDLLIHKLEELKGKQKTIITVCRSGARSGKAQTILSETGLTAFNGGSWNSLQQQINH